MTAPKKATLPKKAPPRKKAVLPKKGSARTKAPRAAKTAERERLEHSVRVARGSGPILIRRASGHIVATLPVAAARALREVLLLILQGDEPRVVGTRSEVSTGEAAALLGVSRQHVARLVDAGTLRARSRHVGTHRRIVAVDVLRFKAEQEQERARAIALADEFERFIAQSRASKTP